MDKGGFGQADTFGGWKCACMILVRPLAAAALFCSHRAIMSLHWPPWDAPSGLIGNLVIISLVRL